jgi:hypothetical protein
VRSVILLRSRPGRPRWQLTTRPTTAAVLGLVSLAAAAAQLALLSSPPPWYQLAVAGFWTVVGLAFLGSAVGTRVRRRREAAAARTRVPVEEMPFVPVPVRPARPRRREEPGTGASSAAASPAEEPGVRPEPDTGVPTDDLADAVRTAATPVVTGAVLAAAGGPRPPVGRPGASTGGMPTLAARLAAPAPPRPPAVPAPRTATTEGAALPAPVSAPTPVSTPARPAPVADPGEPTTRLPTKTTRSSRTEESTGARDRYAVRAVLSAEFAARELEEEAEKMRSAAVPLRDGRVRDRRSAPVEAVPEGAAPEGAVPSPRGVDETPSAPTRTHHRRGRGPRRRPDETTGSRRRVPHDPSHRQPRSGPRGDRPEQPATERPTPERPSAEHPVPERPATERPASDRSVSERPATGRPAAERPAPERTSTDTSSPRASALSFGTGAAASPQDPPREEARAPRPRDPSSDGRPTRVRPADTGRHAMTDAPEQRVSGDGHPGARRARHAASS